MTEENNNKKSENYKWIVGSLIALLAAGSGIAAMLQIFLPKSDSKESPSYSNTSPNLSTVEPKTPSQKSNRISNNINSQQIKNESGNEQPESNENRKIDNASATKIECKVSGTISDSNKTPLRDKEIIFVGAKGNETSLTTSGNNGQFSANCSHISQEEFPGKLFVRKNSLNWKYAPPIPIGGQENLNIYIPEKVLLEAAKNDLRTTIK